MFVSTKSYHIYYIIMILYSARETLSYSLLRNRL
nr:MAG TPA: hypothetical protein [Caudoviricetes sp.]